MLPPAGSESSNQHENDNDDKDQADDTDAAVPVAVAVAAEAAAEAAKQEDDEDDDEYESKRHYLAPFLSSSGLWLLIRLRKHHIWVALHYSGNRRKAISMDHRARFSTLNASYDDFLFAPVCEDANGMRLSVLSALARMNVDPWEEAGRLAAMPQAIAEKALLSALDRVSGRSWKSPEAAAMAARLVRLLPHSGEPGSRRPSAAANPAAAAANGRGRQTSYWWVLLVLSIAISFMVLHFQNNDDVPDTKILMQSGPSTPNSLGPSR
jgi:hypothetical protein